QNDFAKLAGHVITDTGAVGWNDLCDVGPPPPTGNCNPADQTATAGSSSAIQQLISTTTTQIHNAAHQVVTVVDSGSTVPGFGSGSAGPAGADRERACGLVPVERGLQWAIRGFGAAAARQRPGRRDRVRVYGERGRPAVVPGHVRR